MSLEAGGTPVTGRGGQRHRLALLALVASPPAGLSRDRLVALLWPEAEPDRARHLLSHSIYVLRQTLGEDALLAGSDAVRLNPAAVWCDVPEFERALGAGDSVRAVELYRGPFLDGFYLADNVEFEHWVDGERERLGQAYARALQALASEREAATDPAGAALWLRRLAVHDPHDSRTTIRLVRALEASGEIAGALGVGLAHEALLREDLGLGPPGELVQEMERLRREHAGRPVEISAWSTLPRSPELAAAVPAGPSSASESQPQGNRARRFALAAGLVLVTSGFWWMSRGTTAAEPRLGITGLPRSGADSGDIVGRARHPEAHEQLLRGNHYVAQRNPRATLQAITAYNAAARLDSSYALAFARLAQAHQILLDWNWSYGGLSRDSILAVGWAAVERAIRLDTGLADAWLARAMLLQHKYPRTFTGVRQAHERALRLDPKNPETHFTFGFSLRLLGDDATARVQFLRSLAIERDRPIALLHLAWIDMDRRQYAEARRWLDSALAVDPGFYQAYAERAVLRLVTEDTAGARADAETAVRLRPESERLTGEYVLLRLDRSTRGEAFVRSRLSQLRGHAPDPQSTSVHQAAAWAAVLIAAGRQDESLRFLERARVHGPHLRIHLNELYFDPVRTNPVFQSLVGRLRVIEAAG